MHRLLTSKYRARRPRAGQPVGREAPRCLQGPGFHPSELSSCACGPRLPPGHQVATRAPGNKLTNSIYTKQKKTDGDEAFSPRTFHQGKESFPDAPRRSTYTSVQNVGRPQRQALDKARSASVLFRKGLQETSAGEQQGVRLGGKAASKGCVNWLPL